MNVVGCYHSSIRHDYSNIKNETSDIEGEEALRMAVKSINSSVGSEGLEPTLFVFRAFSRLALLKEQPTVSTFHRAVVLNKDTAVII